jgi:hypothetical protein
LSFLDPLRCRREKRQRNHERCINASSQPVAFDCTPVSKKRVVLHGAPNSGDTNRITVPKRIAYCLQSEGTSRVGDGRRSRH